MSNHTPGPWTVGGKSSNTGEAEEIAAADRVIAWTAASYSEDEDEDCVTTEDQANARLIAAAPELLVACRLAVRWLERMTANVDAETDLIDIYEAIAKAEGGE